MQTKNDQLLLYQMQGSLAIASQAGTGLSRSAVSGMIVQNCTICDHENGNTTLLRPSIRMSLCWLPEQVTGSQGFTWAADASTSLLAKMAIRGQS